MTPGSAPELVELFERAREAGFLGPGPIDAHLAHASAWAGALGPFGGRLLDLGSGAGVPGLILACTWTECTVVLLDAAKRRTAWLHQAIRDLSLEDRVETVAARAEVAGHDPRHRERFDLVVARGFGPPAATAECGSAFVVPGGRLSVSEPPGKAPGRWPEERLVELGLGPASRVVHGGASFVILPKRAALAERWPRRDGRPHHRPLW